MQSDLFFLLNQFSVFCGLHSIKVKEVSKKPSKIIIVLLAQSRKMVLNNISYRLFMSLKKNFELHLVQSNNSYNEFSKSTPQYRNNFDGSLWTSSFCYRFSVCLSNPHIFSKTFANFYTLVPKHGRICLKHMRQFFA